MLPSKYFAIPAFVGFVGFLAIGVGLRSAAAANDDGAVRTQMPTPPSPVPSPLPSPSPSPSPSPAPMPSPSPSPTYPSPGLDGGR